MKKFLSLLLALVMLLALAACNPALITWLSFTDHVDIMH